MNEISSLFVCIGDFFQNSAWYAMVKLPFWTLLFTVAAGGVYCARFGKATLLSRGISSTLCILSVYLGAIMLCTYCPSLRSSINLPFLALSDENAMIMHPFSVAIKNAAPVTLKMMILVFLINGADSFCGGGKTFFSWILAEIAAMFFALIFYVLFLEGINMIMPWVFGRFAWLLVLFNIALCVSAILAKFFFTKCTSTVSPYYVKANTFFTTHRMGTLLSTSAMTFLFTTILMVIFHSRGENVVSFISVSRTGLGILMFMVLGVQFIFEIYYQDRKVG